MTPSPSTIAISTRLFIPFEPAAPGKDAKPGEPFVIAFVRTIPDQSREA